MARSNQQSQAGSILNGSLTGTGSGATLIAAQGAGLFTDILTLVLTASAAGSVTLSDGTNTYTFNLAIGTVSIPLPVPLKATTANTAWTFNGASSTTCVFQAVVLAQ